MRGVTFTFSDACNGFPMFPYFSALWEGAGMWDWLPVCWESSEPLKAFQECQRRLPAHSLLNASLSCRLRTGCARQAFIQRRRVFWAHERKAQPFRWEWQDLRRRWLCLRVRKNPQRGIRQTRPMSKCIPGPSPLSDLERQTTLTLCLCLITIAHLYAFACGFFLHPRASLIIKDMGSPAKAQLCVLLFTFQCRIKFLFVVCVI